jgi:hypothetical protein
VIVENMVMVDGPAGMPGFLERIIRQLRRRGLQLGIDDCIAVRQALACDYGWLDSERLRELCVALWAKSASDAELVRSAFSAQDVPVWTTASVPGAGPGASDESVGATAPDPGQLRLEPTAAGQIAGPAPPPGSGQVDKSLVLVPQYPIGQRDIAQAWRRLRRPVRTGPKTEVDVGATIREISRTGVATPPVLVAPRRNTARVLLLVDRQGSMTPYHGLIDYSCRAIERSGRLDSLTIAYFHDTPGMLPDRSVLGGLSDPIDPRLDEILPAIPKLSSGRVYSDRDLTEPLDLAALLDAVAASTSVAIMSDAGAGRGRIDTIRLLDTIALLKALSAVALATVWLNPVPTRLWRASTAEQIARHVPMLPWTRQGFYAAVSILKSRPSGVERPV